jgi:hypothetical protein
MARRLVRPVHEVAAMTSVADTKPRDSKSPMLWSHGWEFPDGKRFGAAPTQLTPVTIEKVLEFTRAIIKTGGEFTPGHGSFAIARDISGYGSQNDEDIRFQQEAWRAHTLDVG